MRDLVPQFFSSLTILSTVLILSQMAALAQIIVTFGLSLENILLPLLFVLIPILALTVAISYLFAIIVTFGRMNQDGEFTALLASGYSLARAARPVIVFGVLLYLGSAACSLYLEPWGRRERVQFYQYKTQTELDNILSARLRGGVFLEDFLGFVLYAEGVDKATRRMKNTLIAPNTKPDQKDNPFVLIAPEGEISGAVSTGDLRLTLFNGQALSGDAGGGKTSLVSFARADIDLLKVFQEQIVGADSVTNDYRSMTPGALYKHVSELKADDARNTTSEYHKARYLLHQRLSVPFAVIILGFFGLYLAIGESRSAKNRAYLGAILTIMGTYVLVNAFKWAGENGHISGPMAAWLPHALLLPYALFLLYQKNRLPPAEKVHAWVNLPWIRRPRLRS